MMPKKRSKKEMKDRIKSDRSFKIWNPDGTLFAEMSEGVWIHEPKKGKKK